MFGLRVLLGMLVMLVLDVPMIKYVIQPTLARSAKSLIASKPDGVAALVFYVGYVSIVVFLTDKFANNTREAFVGGALLGLLAYGTYEFTNKAVIKDWPWTMVAVDTVWGVILTATIAGLVFYAFSRT